MSSKQSSNTPTHRFSWTGTIACIGASLTLASPSPHSAVVPQASYVGGTTLVLDFPFPAFPENMGHWAETLAPIYSVLSAGAWRETLVAAGGNAHIDSILFPNLRRQQLQVCDPVRV